MAEALANSIAPVGCMRNMRVHYRFSVQGSDHILLLPERIMSAAGLILGLGVRDVGVVLAKALQGESQ